MAERNKFPGERWGRELPAVLLLLLFAILINRGIEIRGLYMDDLYLWSCYGEQSFVQYLFPVGSARFRFLYYLAAWLELMLIGPHVGWIVPINIFLNALVSFTVYWMARALSHSPWVGSLCGIAFLASRLSCYQIAQVYGLMETMALWMAVVILYLLYQYLVGGGQARHGVRGFLAACVLYFSVCFVHERYMVLIPLFFLVLIFTKCRDRRLWSAPAISFALVQAIRMAAIGTVLPAGTGNTQVADTFSWRGAVRHALSQAAYIFGFNDGPEHLNGQHFSQSPVWVLILVGVADLALVAITAAFAIKMVRDWKKCRKERMICILFLGFIAGCIACSSVTIRVEPRWVYVSYTASLLFLSWMYGVLTADMGREAARFLMAAPYAAMITVYVCLMLPAEVYYRGMYHNLYFWAGQKQYNSLAEVTYGTYGNQIFGKNIYIVGDSFQMSDFAADTFFKVFDPERKAGGTTVRHIQDVREIGLVADDMLVLQEDPEHNRYIDITLPVRMLKCRGIYGYYADGWMDENAEIQVMAGAAGEIRMNLYYPGEITGEEWVSIYMDGDPKVYLKMEAQQMEASITTQPYHTVTLRFRTNFYVKNAQEQRGEKRLAAILKLAAD